jgi:hypothetical protein
MPKRGPRRAKAMLHPICYLALRPAKSCHCFLGPYDVPETLPAPELGMGRNILIVAEQVRRIVGLLQGHQAFVVPAI